MTAAGIGRPAERTRRRANRSIAQVLGDLVEREVHAARSRRLREATLGDAQVLDALARSREQHVDLTAIVARLESLRR